RSVQVPPVTGSAAAWARRAAYAFGLTDSFGAARWPMNHCVAVLRKVLSSPASVVEPAAAGPAVARTSRMPAAAIPSLRIFRPLCWANRDRRITATWSVRYYCLVGRDTPGV